MARSRGGCHNCKARKVKCDEVRPACGHCQRRNAHCNYNPKLQWLSNVPKTADTLTHTSQKRKYDSHGLVQMKCAVFQAAPIAIAPNKPLVFNNMYMHTMAQLASEDYETSKSDSEGSENEVDNENANANANKSDHVHGNRHGAQGQAPGQRVDLITMNPNEISPDLGIDESPVQHRRLIKRWSYGRSAEEILESVFPAENAGLSDALSSIDPRNLLFSAPPLSEQAGQQFSESILASCIPRELDEAIGLPYRQHFDFFVHVTSQTLVPVPYPENPFQTMIPLLARENESIAHALAAYGASSRAIMTQDQTGSELIKKLVCMASQALKSLAAAQPDSEIALTLAMIMASLEVDRGNYGEFEHYISMALRIITQGVNSIPDDDNASLHLVNLRFVGYMEALGKLTTRGRSDFGTADWWPSWSSGLDYLTGLDLNLLPIFAEVANLAHEKANKVLSLRDISRINRRALFVYSRLYDYYFPEHRAEDQLVAMSLLFQMSLQLHILRRVLGYTNHHPKVQRMVRRATELLDSLIPVDAPIQQSMCFILVSIASEVRDTALREKYLERVSFLEGGHFMYSRRARQLLIDSWAEDSEQTLLVSPRPALFM